MWHEQPEEGYTAGRISIAAAWDGSAVAASVSCADGVHIMGLRVDGTELWPPRTIAPSHTLTPRPTYLTVDAPVLVVREDGAAAAQRRCTIDARGAQADLPAGISVLAGSKGRWLITSPNGEVAVANDQGVAVTRPFRPPFETSFAGDERGFIAAGYDSGRDCIAVTRNGLDGTPTALACFDLGAEVPQAPTIVARIGVADERSQAVVAPLGVRGDLQRVPGYVRRARRAKLNRPPSQPPIRGAELRARALASSSGSASCSGPSSGGEASADSKRARPCIRPWRSAPAAARSCGSR